MPNEPWNTDRTDQPTPGTSGNMGKTGTPPTLEENMAASHDSTQASIDRTQQGRGAPGTSGDSGGGSGGGTYTWNDYRPYVDEIIGGAQAKMSKGDQAALHAFLTQSSGKDPQVQQYMLEAAKKALIAGGVDAGRAESLLKVAYNVQRHPGQLTSDKNDWTYEIDSDFQNLDNFREGFADYTGAGKLAQEAKAKEALDSQAITDKIKAFVASVTGPVSAQDPVYLGLMQAGTDAAQASAGAAGLSGKSGLAGTQAASVAQQNVLPYLGQRQSLVQSGLSLLSNREQGLAGLQQGWSQIEAGNIAAQNAAMDRMYQQQLARNQGLGGIIGGAVGALGYLDSAKTGAATMQAGMSLGAAGANLATPPQAAPRRQQSLSGRSYSPATGYN